MQTEPPEADPPKPKRRCFQFSLRTLLIVIRLLTISCCICPGAAAAEATTPQNGRRH